MSYNDPLVYIIILNYKKPYDTINCIESILDITYKNYKIIIIDNNSQDSSVELITYYIKYNLHKKYNIFTLNNIYKIDKLINIILSDINGGYGFGNNIGIKIGLANKADYLLIINNDTIVEKNFLNYLVSECEKHKEIGIISSKILFMNKPNVIWSNGGILGPFSGRCKHNDYLKIDYDSEIQLKYVTFLTGCVWLIPCSAIEKVGFINEKYFMYVEDVEYCYRFLKAGFKLAVNQNSRIYHKVNENEEINEFTVYWRTRNWIYFIKNNYGLISIISAIYHNIFGMIYKIFKIKKKKKRLIGIILKSIADEIYYYKR